jgi:hypothetical protein
MARHFNGTTDKIVNLSAGLIPPLPVSFACWFKPSDVSADHVMVAHANQGAAVELITLELQGTVAGHPIRARFRNALNAESSAVSTAGCSAGQWYHGCAVFASSSSRTIYLDGANNVTDTTGIGNFGVFNCTGIGVLQRGTPGLFFAGDIQEVGIWNAALTADEVNSLAKGFAPSCVRPSLLVAYFPLFGRGATENNRFKTGDILTPTGTTYAEHGGMMLYPG